ncbi:hypothetical protein FA95DRAFT_1493337, partial [Auriscalpium vulgare]
SLASTISNLSEPHDNSDPLDDEYDDLPGDEPDGSDDEGIELADDPLFRHNDAILENPHNNDNMDDGDALLDDLVPPAFSEHSAIRNSYVFSFVNAAYGGATHAQTHNTLLSQRGAMRAAYSASGNQIPADLRDDLKNMAMTLRTVEKRLGVDPDDVLVYYALCPDCFKRYTLEAISKLRRPRCQADGCDGVLYTTKRNVRDEEKRHPTKLMAYHPLIAALRMFFRRPGKYEECQHWRRDEEDDWEDAPPVDRDEWGRTHDPQAMQSDIYDGYLWRSLIAGTRRDWNEDRTKVEESTTPEETRRFVALPCGLVLCIFVDWMSSKKRGSHSSGAVFVSIQNLPRSKRYLRENIFLLFMIPGPREPTSRELNGLLDLVADEISQLEAGILFDVYGHDEQEWVNACCPMGTLDTPARLSTGGYVPFNTEDFLCIICKQRFSSLVDPCCFDPDTFQYRDYDKELRYKFIARDTTNQEKIDKIYEKKGVMHSVFDNSPHWFGPLSLPLEPMHNEYLGIAADVHKTIILDGGMMVGTGKRDEVTPTARMEQFLENLWVPGSLGRLSSKIASGGGRPKADDWRNFMTVYPAALAVAWDMWNRDPEDTAPQPRANAKIRASGKKRDKVLYQRRLKNLSYNPDATADDMADLADIAPSRNYSDMYLNVLRTCSALRILGSRKLSRSDALRAHGFLCDAFQSWASMGCHLKPNFHFATHTYDYIEAYGTLYAVAVWAFERCIGILSKFKTNGRSGGELECTLMRGWWKTLRCQDLVRRLQDLPDKTPEDLEAIEVLLTAMKGGAESERQRGTLLTWLAEVDEIDTPRQLRYPQRSISLDLRKANFYPIVLAFLQQRWPEHNIVPDIGAAGHCNPFFSTVVSYPTVHVRGTKYGSISHPYGQKYCYGYVDGRHAAQIERLIHVKIETDGPAVEADLAIIRRFQRLDNNQAAPWDAWIDLGYHIWRSRSLDDFEVIDTSKLKGLFAIADLRIPDVGRFWLTMSLSHVCAPFIPQSQALTCICAVVGSRA